MYLFIGRSKIVGTPMAELLKWAHATVTTCHSRTKGVRLLHKMCVISAKINTPKILVSKSQSFSDWNS